MRCSGGWRDVHAAAKRGWITVEDGRVHPIGRFDLLCALPEATGGLIDSETLETVGGATLPHAYKALLMTAQPFDPSTRPSPCP